MTPAEFIAKWNDATRRERQGSQMHFLDLSALLDEPQPTDPDACCFERGATRAGSTDGWAADLSDDKSLERLFALNQERAAPGR
jgi:hypothetical protein